MKAFLTRPIKFSKDSLAFTARKGTPVIVLETKEQTARIMFKYFFRWVHERSIKLKEE